MAALVNEIYILNFKKINSALDYAVDMKYYVQNLICPDLQASLTIFIMNVR